MLLFQFQNYNYRNTLYLWITYSELSEHVLKHLAQYETVTRSQLHVFLLYVQWGLFVHKADSLVLSAQVLVQFTNILEVIKDYECIQCRNIIIYILLDVLVGSIAVYFYESCSILVSLKGKSKYKWWVKIYSDTIHWNV